MPRLGLNATNLVLPLSLIAIACRQDTRVASNCTELECTSSAALLTITGSVEIVGDGDHAGLEPALAFFNAEESRFHIVEVDVEGEFPSGFTIRVAQPPPDAALLQAPDGRLWGLGYLTAIDHDHPDSFIFSQYADGMGGCYAQQCDSVTGECAPPGWSAERICLTSASWCTVGLDACYEETSWCPSLFSTPEECNVTGTTGDPALKTDPWSVFAGLSEDLVVVYLVDPIPATAPAARAFDYLELAAGYHVMQLTEPDDAQRAARLTCEGEALDRALAQYNAEHGTSLRSVPLSELDPNCGSEPACQERVPDVPYVVDCGAQDACDELSALEVGLWEFREQAIAELFCPASDVALRPIDLTSAAGISVRIAPDINPRATPYGGAPRRRAPPDLMPPSAPPAP